MQHNKSPLISPVPGTQRCIDSFHFGSKGQGKKIYIQSSLHADELPGMLVVWKLKQALKELELQGDIQGEVVLVPVANPIGQNQHLMDVHLGRYEMENGYNFNRGYYDPFDDVVARLDGNLSEDSQHNGQLVKQALRESIASISVATEYQSQQKALQLLCCDADIILDLHCDFEAITHTYSTYYSWPAIEPLARALQSSVNMLADDTGGNPFDSCFDMTWKRLREYFGLALGESSCYSVTLELKGQSDVYHEDAEHDAYAILTYLSSLGVIKQPFDLPSSTAQASDLDAVEPLKSTMGGLVVHYLTPGEHVRENQLISEIIDPITDTIEEIRASQPGILFSRTNRRMATAGMLVAHVAGKKKVRSGYLLAP
ncbi:M14 family metallopeptidase [Vibrio sp.]|nr:M14 family metallopeptidase [Vibrio sp.]